MPTTYPERVWETGEVTFEEFAWHCAENFFHDGHIDATFDEESVKRSIEQEAEMEAKITSLLSLSPEKLLAEYRKLVLLAAQNDIRYMERKRIERERYERMLAKARAWSPPTPNQQPLKDFMIQQLELSIEHDCPPGEDKAVPRYLPGMEEAITFQAEEVARLRRQIARSEEYRQKETERAEKKRAYIAALTASLGPRPTR